MSQSPPINPSGQLLRLKEVVRLTGTSRPTVWRLCKTDPSFPKPFKLSEAITCWDEAEIIDWVEAKKAKRCAR